MSYTFLPQSEQHTIKREYRIRVLIVLFFFLSLSLIIGVGSLFPAYVYALLEERLHLNQVAAFQKTSDAVLITAAQKQLAASETIIDAVANSIQPSIFSNTVSSISAVRGHVILNSFVLTHASASTMTIVVSGVAPMRADLLAFKSGLQNTGHMSVDVPISLLAKDTNIVFSIQITETL